MSEIPAAHGIAGSEHLDVRVFTITADNAPQLAERIALVLGEHVGADDELHITYNALQTGWHQDAGRTGWRARPAHTQLFFEHTALIVLRPLA